MRTQGIFRAIAKPVWLHLRDYVRSPAYRALHRFARRLRNRRFDPPCKVHFAGKPIVLRDGPSFLSAWDEIFVNGIYDIGDCRPGPRLVDAGANIGLAALYWKNRYSEFRYVGFEPDPQVAALCRANLTAWGCGGELHECAVTATGGEVDFLPDGADGGRVVGDAATPRSRRVRSTRLSDHLQEATDLLKLDIEGAEVEVLEEIAGRLPLVRNIFVETHSVPGRNQPFAAVFAILRNAGFRCFLHPGFGPERPFARRGGVQGGFETLVNVFGVREGKG